MLLIDNEIKFIGSDVHILLVLLEIELLGLLQTHFYTRFTEVFDECFTLRHTLVCTEEREFSCLTLFVIFTRHFGFRLRKEFGCEGILRTHEKLHTMFVFIEELIFAFWHRTTDNQRSTCIINQDRVHLIHNSVVVSALHEIHRTGGHIVAEVVETKLVVGTERDIARIGTTTLVGVRFVFVNTIYG